MKRTAERLCRDRPADGEDFVVLNVGFGLGLVRSSLRLFFVARNDKCAQIDTELQRYSPTKHLIIEAHPDVHAYMRAKGFYDKPGVEIFEGTWQDYLKQVESGEREGMVFDAIYWCVYASSCPLGGRQIAHRDTFR